MIQLIYQAPYVNMKVCFQGLALCVQLLGEAEPLLLPSAIFFR